MKLFIFGLWISFVLFHYPLYGFTIVIDAGHGGKDPGAVFSFNKQQLFEKNINLGIARALKSMIRKHLKSVRVVMTRDSDVFVKLEDRVKKVNQFFLEESILISIHVNSHASRPDLKGVEVFYHDLSTEEQMEERRKALTKINFLKDPLENKQDLILLIDQKVKQLSFQLARHLAKGLELASQEPIRKVKSNDFWVNTYSIIPSALIEVGFIGNEKFQSYNYYKRISKGIFIGILNYLNQE